MEMIKFAIKNGIAWITLNRPDKMNALNAQLRDELTGTLEKVGEDDEVRAVVLTGEGRGFCSGQDLNEVTKDMEISDIVKDSYSPLIEALTGMEKPVIAAVNGTAAGAGMSLALACDFRLAHEEARFVQAFIHIGLVPDSGSTYFLPRLVGHAKAMELAVLGEKVSADQAKELGLVTKVVTSGDWIHEVQAFANKLANMPTKAIGLIKRYMQKSWEGDLNDVLESEAYAQQIAAQTDDHNEGVQAFIEKRKPVFKGR